MFSNLFKATLGTVLSPVALVVDIVQLPATAYDSKEPFGNTSKMLKQVGKNISKSLE